MTGVASASENRSFKASEGRLYAAALKAVSSLGYSIQHTDSDARVISFNTGFSMRSWAGASLLIASPLLYLIFVAIIAFRDRVRMNAIMHQRVVALNLAPLSYRTFRFAKSSEHAIVR